MRRIRGIVAVGSLVLAACSATPPPTNEQKHTLDEFYSQKLTWGECTPFATDTQSRELFTDDDYSCARMLVPMDYSNLSSPQISIGLLRTRAGDPAKKIGTLVVGTGPEYSGMSLTANVVREYWNGDLAARFDIVGFDVRGTGPAKPTVKCLPDKEKDARRADPPNPADVAAVERKYKELADSCASSTGTAMLANIGTRDVARDLDILRSLLGDRKLTFAGFSHGTRLGTTYAETFPGNVRAMVLDSPGSPGSQWVAETIAQVAGFQRALDGFAADCATQPDCPLGTDPAQVRGRVEQLLRSLKKQPLQVGDRKLSFSDALAAFGQAVHYQSSWPTLQESLRQLATGRGEVLLLTADRYYGRGADGRYTPTQDAALAVRCVDNPRVNDRAAVADDVRRVKAASPPSLLLDEEVLPPALGPCAFWSVPTTLPSAPAKAVKDLKPLVIASTNDPGTPYQAGVDLAKALGGGLLTVQAHQHTEFLRGIGCVDTVATAYLIDLKQPAPDARC